MLMTEKKKVSTWLHQESHGFVMYLDENKDGLLKVSKMEK